MYSYTRQCPTPIEASLYPLCTSEDLFLQEGIVHVKLVSSANSCQSLVNRTAYNHVCVFWQHLFTAVNVITQMAAETACIRDQLAASVHAADSLCIEYYEWPILL
jgi:hypothetical protein